MSVGTPWASRATVTGAERPGAVMLPSSLGRLAHNCTKTEVMAARRIPAARPRVTSAARVQNAVRRVRLRPACVSVLIEYFTFILSAGPGQLQRAPH